MADIDARLLNAFERSSVRFNACLLLCAIVFALSSSLQNSAAAVLFVVQSKHIFYAALAVSVLCLCNIIISVYSGARRILTAEVDAPVVARTEGLPKLRVPENLRLEPLATGLGDRADEVIAGMAAAATAKPATESPSRRALMSPLLPPIPSDVDMTPQRKSPLPSSSSPMHSVVSFAAVYGTDVPSSPLRRAATPSTPIKQTSAPSSPKKTSHSPALSAATSPLPATGSPKVDALARSALPDWTEQLRQTIVTQAADAAKRSPLARSSSLPSTNVFETPGALAQPTVDDESLPRARVEPRIVYDPEQAVGVMGLTRSIDAVTDLLRQWFLRKILTPLSSEIADLSAEFSRANLEHLGPASPASFPAFGRAAAQSASSQPSFVINTSGGAARVRPQTLFDLSQQCPGDALVQRRLRLERYLSAGGITNLRAHTIKRIHELASTDGPLASFCVHSPVGGVFGAGVFSEEDAVLLMHLFCVFMDEQLPSEGFYETSAFTARYFVGPDEQPSTLPDALQIQQVLRQPLRYRFIAGGAIYDTYAGSTSFFTAIVYLVEWAHRTQGGFLGVGNLGSPAIDLTSILQASF